MEGTDPHSALLVLKCCASTEHMFTEHWISTPVNIAMCFWLTSERGSPTKPLPPSIACGALQARISNATTTTIACGARIECVWGAVDALIRCAGEVFLGVAGGGEEHGIE